MSVALLHSPAYHEVLNRGPEVLKNRYDLFVYLLQSWGVVRWSTLRMLAPVSCARAQLEEFHSTDYIASLIAVDSSAALSPQSALRRLKHSDVDAESCGLCDDCAPFPGVYEYVRAIAGASLCAADLLVHSKARVAVNFGGGWHHAKPGRGAGFCFVNDCVLAIMRLQDGGLQRVLYVDIDAHHGDGVQEAFYRAEDVFTLSFHHRAPGFFPSTGDVGDIGAGPGRHRSLNIPLRRGCSDAVFWSLFTRVLPPVLKLFRPDALVVQCGADSLSSDPLGGLNLTSYLYVKCVDWLHRLDLPMLVLGGGGYHPPSTARCWALILARLCGIIPPTVIADNSDPNSSTDSSFLQFGDRPDFESHTAVRVHLPDLNSRDYLLELLSGVQRYFNDAAADIRSKTVAPLKSAHLENAVEVAPVIAKDNSSADMEIVDPAILNSPPQAASIDADVNMS
jgi:acetoin utilization deacetylase AcuC-like enzyme